MDAMHSLRNYDREAVDATVFVCLCIETMAAMTPIPYLERI